MPQSTVEWRREATEEELRTRTEEMRDEWAELSRMDRESGEYRKAKAEFLNEVEEIDVNLTLRAMSQTPAALDQSQRAVGATNGVGTLAVAERRSAGELA